MPAPWTIAYSPPPSYRQVPGFDYGLPTNWSMIECTFSFSWGIQPGTASVTLNSYAHVPTPESEFPPVTVGGLVHLYLAGHHFWGICQSNLPVVGTSGCTTPMQLQDMRKLLQWDDVFGCFNKLEVRTIGGQRIRRYWHIYPENFPGHIKTYTNAPLTAAQILAKMFAAPTTESPWRTFYADINTGAKTLGYHPDLVNYPSFDIDCMNGMKLGSAMQMVLDQHGILVTIISDSNPASAYDLVFARKGQGPIPAFPANSNDRRDGQILSEIPTRVRVVGGRNRYQLHDLRYDPDVSSGNHIIPDWLPAWEQFFADPSILRDWVFWNMRTDASVGSIPPNTRYDNIDGDIEYTIGKQLAAARAMEMTVADFAFARDDLGFGDGASFRDYRSFGGRCRMDMPALLYAQSLVFRAFRLTDDFHFTNGVGRVVDLSSINLVSGMVARVSHNPATGEMDWNTDAASDGAGYGIAQGFMVGADGFKAIRPDRFKINDFTNQQHVWTHVPFQIDDSGGADGSFIIFDQPVVKTENLFTTGSDTAEIAEYNGFAATNAAPGFTVPRVRVALAMECEQFLYSKGAGVIDDSVSVAHLSEWFVGNEGGLGIVPYADAQTAADKADRIATNYLARQWYYRLGGFRRPIGINGPPTFLHGCIDRVTVKLSANEALQETVDFTGERSWLGFQGEREFDRGEKDKTLFPGQQQLREDSQHMKIVAATLKQDRKTLQTLVDAWHGRTTAETAVDPTNAPATVKAYTPLARGDGKTLPRFQADATYNVFAGVSVQANVVVAGKKAPTVRVVSSGEIPCRVKGPVAANDALGLSAEGDYLTKGGAGACALAMQKIEDASVKVIWVRIGGGAPASAGMNFKGEWVNGVSYSIGDVVVVRGGVSGGTYICVMKTTPAQGIPMDPAQDPSLGVYWVQLASGNTMGTWT
jgi:hypothetical protein